MSTGEEIGRSTRGFLCGSSDDGREVELLWNGKTNEVTNVVLPFQVIEQIDEPRSDAKFGNQNSPKFTPELGHSHF